MATLQPLTRSKMRSVQGPYLQYTTKKGKLEGIAKYLTHVKSYSGQIERRKGLVEQIKLPMYLRQIILCSSPSNHTMQFPPPELCRSVNLLKSGGKGGRLCPSNCCQPPPELKRYISTPLHLKEDN